jgi:hypothetical protein
MPQHTSTDQANDYPEISRRITRREYEEAVNWARAAGLTNFDIQGPRFLWKNPSVITENRHHKANSIIKLEG